MLLPAEDDALAMACDEERLKQLGFLISPEGSVKWRTRKGGSETVFPIGFLSGFRKLKEASLVKRGVSYPRTFLYACMRCSS